MLKSDAQTPVSNSPVVEYTVSVPAGSTALAAVQKAADDHGFDVITKDVVDYYDSTKTHQAITDIGRIGETYIDPTLKECVYNASGYKYKRLLLCFWMGIWYYSVQFYRIFPIQLYE